MAYKSPFNQDPTLKKTISNVFGKTIYQILVIKSTEENAYTNNQLKVQTTVFLLVIFQIK